MMIRSFQLDACFDLKLQLSPVCPMVSKTANQVYAELRGCIYIPVTWSASRPSAVIVDLKWPADGRRGAGDSQHNTLAILHMPKWGTDANNRTDGRAHFVQQTPT